MLAKISRFEVKGLRAKFHSFQRKHFIAMKRLWRDAVRAFIKEATGHIHVDSGMTAASFYPVARDVGMSFHMGGSARKGLTLMNNKYEKNRWRSVTEGAKAGKKGVGYRLNYGSEKRPFMVFEFKINVWQFGFHDPNWGAIDAGFDAFEKYIDKNWARYMPFESMLDCIFPSQSMGGNY